MPIRIILVCDSCRASAVCHKHVIVRELMFSKPNLGPFRQTVHATNVPTTATCNRSSLPPPPYLHHAHSKEFELKSPSVASLQIRHDDPLDSLSLSLLRREISPPRAAHVLLLLREFNLRLGPRNCGLYFSYLSSDVRYGHLQSEMQYGPITFPVEERLRILVIIGPFPNIIFLCDT